MTSTEVKQALYARHHAATGVMPGAWTCIEEWRAIDLLAVSAWSSQGRYARVGYEIKVSRTDLRRELLRPYKRKHNVEWCNEFYLAVPAGLLTDEELTYQEPEWAETDFHRIPCRFSEGPERPPWDARVGPCNRGKRSHRSDEPGERPFTRRVYHLPCENCGGSGYEQKSRVEKEAPTCWIPRDVGLITIDGRGCTVTRKSPHRKEVPDIKAGMELGQLIRYISIRPDPRHHPAR